VFKPVSSANMLKPNQLFQVTLFRPFAPLQKISAKANDATEKVHFIVPLAGREDTFRSDRCFPCCAVYALPRKPEA